jgi:hypothetical protein
MVPMIWKLCGIRNYKKEIDILFQQNKYHKHASNYLKYPLFEWTAFARMGFDPHLVYYSAGIERPEYNGSIRIMSRHTRDIKYNFGGWKADLTRGLETLDLSTEMAIDLGYDDIWVSREESPNLLEYFKSNSKYKWKVNYERLPVGGTQYVLRKA